MRLNNIKVIICIIIVLIIVLITGCIVFKICSSNKKQVDDAEMEEDSSEDYQVEMISIKSTPDNKIEQDSIEVESIEIAVLKDELEVKSILKNNSDKELKGYYIEIELLDNENNIKTVITDNSKETIEIGNSKEITNYVSGLENPLEIVNARIKNLEKDGIKKSLDQTMDGMIPDLEE